MGTPPWRGITVRQRILFNLLKRSKSKLPSLEGEITGDQMNNSTKIEPSNLGWVA